MGYLTTFTIYNDGVHLLKDKKYQKKFCEDLYSAASRTREKEEIISIGCFVNAITAHPPRHADDRTIYVHMGNCTTEINAFSKGTERLVKENPIFAKKILDFLKIEILLLEKKYYPKEKKPRKVVKKISKKKEKEGEKKK